MSNDGGVWAKVWPDSVGTPEATITAITGSGVTHTYGDFVAFEFLTSGTLTSTEGLVPEVLAVGGGGGGGTGVNGVGNGGGGGGGGLIYANDFYVPSSAIPITVGSGGANTVNGDASNFSSITVVGGGSGGSNGINASYGGSGGGGFGGSGGTSTGGDGIVGQGNPGITGSNLNASGGGGFSGAGVVMAGGAGLSLSITGSAVIYSTGGTGGGITSGASNTGNGAGGGVGATPTGGSGGSGVVILKVKASNAANVDKSGWTEVTEAMLAAAAKKREIERKAQAKKAELLAKTEELSGATQTDIKETE
jgi:hypothetical protein